MKQYLKDLWKLYKIFIAHFTLDLFKDMWNDPNFSIVGKIFVRIYLVILFVWFVPVLSVAFLFIPICWKYSTIKEFLED